MSKDKLHQGIEVRADAAGLLVAAFDVFPSIADKYLRRLGFSSIEDVGRLKPGTAYIPLGVWLDTFDAVLREIGPNALYRFGLRGIQNPNLSRSARGLEEALGQVDVAYHQSHRKAGRVMFNARTHRMEEGIGHYRVEDVGTRRVVRVRVDTPYPCPAEHGLLYGLATQFEPRAVVRHAEGSCRLTGGASCAYLISW